MLTLSNTTHQRASERKSEPTVPLVPYGSGAGGATPKSWCAAWVCVVWFCFAFLFSFGLLLSGAHTWSGGRTWSCGRTDHGADVTVCTVACMLQGTDAALKSQMGAPQTHDAFAGARVSRASPHGW
jgi:hypothetical protein